MESLKTSVRDVKIKISQTQNSCFGHLDLLKMGLCSITPRDYQLFGINWLVNSCNNACNVGGVILGDEMGLGKTFQTVSFLLCEKAKKSRHICLILSPLAVIDGWRKELQRCAPTLRTRLFIGYKDEREKTKEDISSLLKSTVSTNAPFDVLLTSYEICMKEKEFLKRFDWNVLVVDEAHRLKNSSSVLYSDVSEFRIHFKVLLTGTPVQNNLKEIYALLSFISPKIFPTDVCEEFVEYFASITNNDATSSVLTQQLHDLIKPFLLRRTKNEVTTDLPTKSEVLLYCGMTGEQKKLYKAILTKDIGVFAIPGGHKMRLMNILMQLRKCCNHPYMFPGIEPEPYQLGEHLVEASGKLYLLDKLLTTLKKSGHKVLLFSQMTAMLDIIQDYLGYRGYTYERLDGSVRGEERFLAINSFSETDDTFLFLLSTRAGGQGLNLMAADTVIFVDNDFNPQNDLQAAARAHRIGQTRPVKIIRLVTKNTVEEIILNRANSKLSLTDTVVEGGQFSNITTADTAPLNSILKFGLEDLLKSDENSYKDNDFEKMLGRTLNGKWESDKVAMVDSDELSLRRDIEPESIYMYEGQDYSKVDASTEDTLAFEELLKVVNESVEGERTLRKDRKGTAVYLPEPTKRKRKSLTNEEKEQRKQKIEENRVKRLKLVEEQNKIKLEKLWARNNYTSCRVDLPIESDSESSSSDGDNFVDAEKITYLVGDVTSPQHIGENDAIVIHCVDDSGYWGSGGLFTAINNRSQQPKHQYEMAYKMKDLSLGDLHLVKMLDVTSTNAIYVGFIVAQTRNDQNFVSPLLMNHLDEGLEKVYNIAQKTKASVHFPRIGYKSPNFNWYGTERLIKKILPQRNIPTFIYYFKRHNVTSHQVFSSSLSMHASQISPPRSDEKQNENETARDENKAALPDVFSTCCIHFHGNTPDKRLIRYIIAYDGEVDKNITENTTHIICTQEEIRSLDTRNTNENCKFVTKEWIEESVKRQKLADEIMYSVKYTDFHPSDTDL